MKAYSARLRVFLKHREGRETFQQFTARLDVGRLQEIFGSDV